MKIALLGVTGMLGNTVLEVFSQSKYDLLLTARGESFLSKIKRGEKHKLDAQKSTVSELEEIIKDCDYAVNCIGIIKSYIHDNNSKEVQTAIEVNSLFPHKLSLAAKNSGTKIIQIATDCVFDGSKGNYNENDKHNPLDVYGKTKSLGEVFEDNVLNLRCSIIGKELKSKTSLLEWFLNQPLNAKVNGFNNHLWNGLTTKVFAKICLGIISNNVWFSGLQHIVPKDYLSKAQMLKIFAKTFNREDININEMNAEESINRTLSTLDSKRNKDIWQMASYDQIPSVEDMIKDM